MIDRMARINAQVKRELSLIIQRDIADSRLQFVSILRVVVSRDLRNARVFYSVLGEDFEIEEAKEAFRGRGGAIRRILASRVRFRFVPELIFEYDRSLADSIKIDETLKEIYGDIPDYKQGQSQETSGDSPESRE
ncbi:MAG: ribosome-binding factor A [Candidatus Omnitrophica bacterium CG12_big_fil_rev_8_21_14_0_65_50_5]|nr:MAG: ribosome-binding factor A [Candidatus Omnitrophica bacterium CG12_big_fil_rev_8_21_14_0_65_50_5]